LAVGVVWVSEQSDIVGCDFSAEQLDLGGGVLVVGPISSSTRSGVWRQRRRLL
jgi:hypothetical protein